MRDSCGANDHPDPFLFISMYKLISTFSLIKPPKGCNVEGVEIFQVLLSLQDVENSTDRKEKWENMLEAIMDKGSCNEMLHEEIVKEHNYSHAEASKYAISYVAGCVSRKGKRLTKFGLENCNDCSSTLTMTAGESVPERHKLINLKSKGFLQHPSVKLYDLISVLENALISVLEKNNIQADTLFQVTEKLSEIPPIPFIGCEKHNDIFTKRILTFYLTMRMLLICKRYNLLEDKEQKLIKEKQKSAKLVGIRKQQNSTCKGSAMDCCDDTTKIAIKKKRIYKGKDVNGNIS